MMRYFLMILMLCLASPAPAGQGLKYYPDPVYQKLSPEDAMPMEDIFNLAKDGDVRAQFILGDLYAKGKGGVAKDLKEARRWFEESAIHGYDHSFIRLAALAKHDKKPVEAWAWYSLAVKSTDFGDKRKYAMQARHELAEGTPLTQEDLREARKLMNDWEDFRDKKLYEEKQAAFEKRNKETTVAGAEKHEQN